MSATLAPAVATLAVTVDRLTLKDALAHLTKAVGRRVTLPALSGVRVTVHDQVVVLEATDLERSVTVKLPAYDATPGAPILVPGRLLSKLVGNAVGVTVELAVTDDQQLMFTSGTAFSTLRLMPVDDFPQLPEPDGRPAILADTACDVLGRVAKAASTDAARPVLTGVLFSCNGEVATTDSYRLMKANLGSHLGPIFGDTLVPATTVQQVASWKTDVYATFDRSQVSFEADVVKGPKKAPRRLNVRVVTRLIEGTFPNYTALIPEDHNTRWAVKADELSAAVKTLPVGAANTPVLLSYEHGTLKLEAGSQEVGHGTATVYAQQWGDDGVNIAFNPGFLVAMMDAVQGEVVIELRDGLKPATFHCSTAKDDGVFGLLMPMRVS